MGDRCFMRVSIHGHIPDKRTFAKLFDALATNRFGVEEFDDDKGLIVDTFAHALLHPGVAPYFTSDDVNYADASDLEQELQILLVPYVLYNGPGDDYGASTKSWWPGRGYQQVMCDREGDPVLLVKDVADCLTGRKPLATLKNLVADARLADGTGMPPFTVGDEVRRYLSTRAAKKALID